MDMQEARTKALAERWTGQRNFGQMAAWSKNLVDYLEGKPLNEESLRAYMAHCFAQGLEPSTVSKRMANASVVVRLAGYNDTVPFPRLPRKLKWWLNPDAAAMACAWCSRHEPELGQFIAWTIGTGLRVEESLRVQAFMFDFKGKTLTVPGSKGDTAQATLALSTPMVALAQHLLKQNGGKLFSFEYHALKRLWAELRDAMKWPEYATLKALRRSFAHKFSSKGGPAAVLQQMLRHADYKTTQGYLQLVGGFDTEVQRQWLD